ncbi:MAG: YfhO family protein [Bacteroidales bacterium]|nr:YfhO family protein [Bacteroidales bacterium]
MAHQYTRENITGGGKEHKPWYRMTPTIIAGIIVLFVALSYAYFYPAAFEGRVLFQMDGAAAAGTGRDVKAFEEETGEVSRWTGSLFGGMPTYQISPSYPSVHPVRDFGEFLRLEWPLDLMPGDTYLLFMLLMGGLLFFKSWGTKWSLSILGALMWTFSSYFLILIDAGHLWKLLALAYVPPTIAGLVYAFHRRRYVLGAVVTGIFTALQVYSNHVQMSYYFAFVMVAMVIAWAVETAKTKEWVHFGKALGAVLLGGVLGLLINGSNLYHTWEYQKETMRGGREITVPGNDESPKPEKDGLDKAYITQWSYGIDEMLTFLVPDAKGGYSAAIGGEKVMEEGLQGEVAQFVAQQNRYWGDQPFTAGPVYVGAFVLLLAFFGMIVAKGPMKWALIAVTALTVMLSWGHNFPALTNFFIDYFPLYNKFRTPSSILVVAEFTLPIFAVWGLSLLLKDRDATKRKDYLRAMQISVVITVGVTLFVLVMGPASSFLSEAERSAFASYASRYPQMGQMAEALEKVRRSIFVSDAYRTLWILLVGIVLLALYFKGKLKSGLFLAGVGVLCLVDLWTVDKRYLNDGKYLPKTEVDARVSRTTPADLKILEDTTQYRVMNLTVNTFNDATTSYLHRSVGGYHAAKLQRYQDVIDGYLSKFDTNVLRALNTKYYIVPDSVGGQNVVTDKDAYGDAWFVSEVRKAKNADEEFRTLGEVPLNQIAVVAPPFGEKVAEKFAKDSLSVVSLQSYRPNEVKYRTTNSGSGFAVFSEIFYPHGWTATIDGKEVPILRTDYILRGLEIPAGTHEVVFSFHPKSLKVTETISYISSFILLVLALFEARKLYNCKRKEPL